jgi:hypothetical protein
MRFSAMLARIALPVTAAVCGGCFESRTVDCGNGFLCPAEQACAAPGHCGEPAQVEKCDGKPDWDACAFTDTSAGSCRFGVCEACTPDREGCGGGWRGMSPPTTQQLNDVWVAARADAYAVGNAGTLLHYDGTGWSAVITEPPIPSTIDLQSIWGSSGDDFYVISSDAGERNVLHLTDRTTLTTETMASYGLKAVWGSAADAVYVVGLGGTIRRRTSAGWQEVSSGGLPLAKIHGSSATRAFAIGPSGSYARLDGSTWTPGTITASAILTDVWAGETEAFVTGEDRTLLRLAGTAWQPVTFNATVPIGLDLFAVWGDDGWFFAVGDAGKVLLSMNGTDWSDESPPIGTSALRAIDGTSRTNIFVVGAAGAIWQYSQQ